MRPPEQMRPPLGCLEVRLLAKQETLGQRRADFKAGLRAYGLITLGVLIFALGMNFFLAPNKIAAGGVSGLSVVLLHTFGFPPGITMLVLNIPLFLFGARVLGASFGARSVFGFVTLSLAVDGTAPFLPTLTEDPLLASLYGGVLMGIGSGLTYRVGGSTGGTAIAARLISHYTNMSVGRALLIADGVVILAAGVAFGPELALYGLLAVFLTMRVVDLLEEGAPYVKAALIVTDVAEEISAKIISDLGRGVTSMPAQGMYTKQDRNLLFVTLYQDQVGTLKQLVHEVDPDAFVVITDVHEALGEGFRSLR